MSVRLRQHCAQTRHLQPRLGQVRCRRQAPEELSKGCWQEEGYVGAQVSQQLSMALIYCLHAVVPGENEQPSAEIGGACSFVCCLSRHGHISRVSRPPAQATTATTYLALVRAFLQRWDSRKPTRSLRTASMLARHGCYIDIRPRRLALHISCMEGEAGQGREETTDHLTFRLNYTETRVQLAPILSTIKTAVFQDAMASQMADVDDEQGDHCESATYLLHP